MVPRLLLAGLALAALLGPGCGEESEIIPSHMLLGTLTSSSVDAGGSWAYLRLVEPDGSLDSTILFQSRCQFVGPSCDYQINQVLEGEYSVHAMVDMNSNAEQDDPRPDTDDLVSPVRPLLLWERTQLDYPDSAWHRQP